MIAFLKKVWAWGEPIGEKMADRFAKNPKSWVLIVGVTFTALGHTLPDDTVAKLAADIASIFAT